MKIEISTEELAELIEGLQEDVILRVTFEVEQDDGEDEV